MSGLKHRKQLDATCQRRVASIERGQETLNHWLLPSRVSWAGGAGQQKGERAGLGRGRLPEESGTMWVCAQMREQEQAVCLCMNLELILSLRLEELSDPREAKGPPKSNSRVHLYLSSILTWERWRHVSHGPGP